jgi:hypothetical protein
MLSRFDLTVPDTTPQTIIDASAHMAAWLFRRRRDLVGAEAFYAEAMKFLEVYASDAGEPAFKVVSDE